MTLVYLNLVQLKAMRAQRINDKYACECAKNETEIV